MDEETYIHLGLLLHVHLARSEERRGVDGDFRRLGFGLLSRCLGWRRLLVSRPFLGLAGRLLKTMSCLFIPSH